MKKWMKWSLAALAILVIAGFLLWKFWLPTLLIDGPGMVYEDEIISISYDSGPYPGGTLHTIKAVRDDQNQTEVTVRRIAYENAVPVNRVFEKKDIFIDITEIVDKYNLNGITNDNRKEALNAAEEITSTLTIEYRYSPAIVIDTKYQYSQQEMDGYAVLRNYLFSLDEGLGIQYTDNKDPYMDYKLNTLEDVSITLSSITKKGCICTFSNLSDRKYTYGDFFIIYKYNDNGQWIGLEYITPHAAFNAIGYTLNKGGSADKDYDWGWLYGSLPKGRYLFIVDITPDGYREPFYLSQEFEIS